MCELPPSSLCPPARRALPTLVEPSEQPLVTLPTRDPLVVMNHPNITEVAVYHHYGWPGAPDRVWVRQSVAVRLAKVAHSLGGRWGLALLDGWRPLVTQHAIYDAAYAHGALPEGFVSPPSQDPLTPPPHVSGGAVDVTLTFDGVPLALGTAFDEFTELAYTAHFERLFTCEDVLIRDLRRFLFTAMSHEGFVVLECEWWHFEFGTRRWAAIRGGVPLFGPAEHRADQSG